MKHEKIIKDDRGTIRIEVFLWIVNSWQRDQSRNEFRYDVIVWHKQPQERLEVNNSSIATETEIEQAKLEFWNKIKP